MTTSSMHDKQEDSRTDPPADNPIYASGSHPPWPFPTNTQQVPSSSSSQMIGPTSSFYDPEVVSTHDPQSQDYQTWLEAYRDPPDQQSIFDPTTLQGQYTFVSSHYTHPSPANIAIEHTSTYSQTHAPLQLNPSSESTLRGAVPYHQQGPDPYFYAPNVPDRARAAQQYDAYSTPPMSKSTPTATYASSPSLSTPGSASVATYAASTTSTLTGYTPPPNRLGLPASHSRSHSHTHSSVSPSSWTEDSIYSSASLAAAPQPTPVTPATATRTPPKKGAATTKRTKSSPQSGQKGKRKRQKKTDVAESDSASDDEADVHDVAGSLSSAIGSGGLGGPDPVVPSRL